MKMSNAMIRKVPYLLTLVVLSAALAACGGGGSGTASSGGGTGGAAVGVSLTGASAYPAGTVFAVATTASVEPAAQPAPNFEHVWVTATKIAFIPSTGPEFPDQNGELEEMNGPMEEGNSGMKGFPTIVLPSPVTFDLLNPPTGEQVARFFNKSLDVPPGEYSKIRIYYSQVEGESNGTFTPFHQTAHYHFDVHFVGGNLIIPVASNPKGGISFFSISINVVGLKIHQAGNSGNILMRPQVFAKVEPVIYLVTGVAQFVNPPEKTFEINTGTDNVTVVHDSGTKWLYVDNTVPSSAWASVGKYFGDKALMDTALVDAFGTFSSDMVLHANEVDVTFPDVLDGKVFNGWTNDTLTLRRIGDNVVFPMPSRATAYYDNAVGSAYTQIINGDQVIFDNTFITARGYFGMIGIRVLEAFWISIGSTGP